MRTQEEYAMQNAAFQKLLQENRAKQGAALGLTDPEQKAVALKLAQKEARALRVQGQLMRMHRSLELHEAKPKGEKSAKKVALLKTSISNLEKYGNATGPLNPPTPMDANVGM